MNLREAKQAIRSFIQMHWSDQKLAEVYAFNADGKMDCMDTCGCLMGVTLSPKLHVGHQKDCPVQRDEHYDSHYALAQRLANGRDAELAYIWLNFECGKGTQRNILSAIIRAEMRRRARLFSGQHEAAQTTAGLADTSTPAETSTSPKETVEAR